MLGWWHFYFHCGFLINFVRHIFSSRVRPIHSFSVSSLSLFFLLFISSSVSRCLRYDEHKNADNPDTKPEIKNHYRGHKLSMWLSLIPQIHSPGESPDLSMRHHHFIEENPQFYDGKADNPNFCWRKHENCESKIMKILFTSEQEKFVYRA